MRFGLRASGLLGLGLGFGAYSIGLGFSGFGVSGFWGFVAFITVFELFWVGPRPRPRPRGPSPELLELCMFPHFLAMVSG